MTTPFDPYHRWLGIRSPERPPNHYRLLGLEPFENDVAVILDAAERQISHVQKYATGEFAAVAQRILNELVAAKTCLTHPPTKEQYDAHLRMTLVAPGQSGIGAAAPMPPSPAQMQQPQTAPAQPMAAAAAVAAPQPAPIDDDRPMPMAWLALGGGVLFLIVVIASFMFAEPDNQPQANQGDGSTNVRQTPLSNPSGETNGSSRVQIEAAKIEDQRVEPGGLVHFVVQAKSSDVLSILQYELMPGAPPGATVDELTGEFRWHVPDTIEGRYPVTIRVKSSEGGPSLDRRVVINVAPKPEPMPEPEPTPTEPTEDPFIAALRERGKQVQLPQAADPYGRELPLARAMLRDSLPEALLAIPGLVPMAEEPAEDRSRDPMPMPTDAKPPAAPKTEPPASEPDAPQTKEPKAAETESPDAEAPSEAPAEADAGEEEKTEPPAPMPEPAPMRKRTYQEQDLPKLIAALAEEDKDVQVGAAVGIAEFGPQASAALPHLLGLLKQKDPRVHWTMALALSSLGSDAVPELVLALQNEDAGVRHGAALALGNFKQAAREAIAPLVAMAMNDRQPAPRAAALEALGEIAPQFEDAVLVFFEGIKDGKPEVQKRAAGSLQLIGAKVNGHLPAVRDALSHDDDVVREAAAELLADVELAERDGVELLLDSIKSDNNTVVAAAIGRMQDITPDNHDLVPLLLRRLEDSSALVRQQAIAGLGRIGPRAESAVESLAALLADESDEVRLQAALALAGIGSGSAKALPDLIIAFKDKNGDVRNAASLAAGQIGPAAIFPLLTALKSENTSIRAHAALALGEIGPAAKPAVGALEAAQEDTYSRVRTAATMALKKIQLDKQ